MNRRLLTQIIAFNEAKVSSIHTHPEKLSKPFFRAPSQRAGHKYVRCMNLRLARNVKGLLNALHRTPCMRIACSCLCVCVSSIAFDLTIVASSSSVATQPQNPQLPPITASLDTCHILEFSALITICITSVVE